MHKGLCRRLFLPTVGGAVVLCSLALGVSAGATTRPERVKAATTATDPVGTNAPVGNPAECPWLGTGLSTAQRVSMLMGAMTLPDKLNMMEGGRLNGAIGGTKSIPALCIPAVTNEDGPAGVADGVSGVTQLPAPVNDAATFDTAEAKQYGQVLGNEEWTKGNMVVYGPTINIDRDPRWGRNFESLSEDPFLTGAMGSSIIEGIQSQGPEAQVKHYAVYNVETNRNTVLDDDIIDPRTEHEIYLQGFYQTAIKAGAGSVMCAYSSPNGTFACDNPALLSILENQWGYKGYVSSDFGAVHTAVPAVNAGLDQEEGSSLFGPALMPAVLDGQIQMATIDDAVQHVLTSYFDQGFFEDQPTGNEQTLASTPAHVAFAQQNSEEGTVLLRNAGSILPLSPSTTSIAVIGADGTTTPETIGGGSAGVNPTGDIISPLQGIQDRAGSGVNVTSYSGTDPTQAATAAAGADVAIVFANNHEGEGSDLPDITLQNDQDAFIEAVAAANPHTIVVLNTGGPVTMPWLDQVQGVLEAWYPGQQDGAALASILFGDTDPSGHLPETFPSSLAQIPTANPAQFPGTNGKVLYSEGLEVGYRWYDTQNITPLFPFGFGLSYTSFKYSHLKLSANNVQNTTSGPDAGQSTTEETVTATVTNTGKVAGADVAQLYVGDPASTGEPVRQLEGFQRVMLNPGQSKTVSFPLTGHELSFYDTSSNGWVLPTGTFTAYVGDSSALENLPLQKSFGVTKSVGGRQVTLSAPASTAPGSTITVSATFNNPGSFALTGVSAKLQVPAGWRSTVQTGAPAKVVAGGSATVSWTVKVPTSAQGTSGDLTASISGSTKGAAATEVAHATQTVSVDPALEVSAPPSTVVNPGTNATVQLKIKNRLPDAATATIDLPTPAGVTITPSPVIATIPADSSVTVKLTVSATAAAAGPQMITPTVTAMDGDTTINVAPEAAANISLNVAFASLAAAFNNTGISDSATPSGANFDGRGDSFSEEALTAAGLAPGALVAHDGLAYMWPSAAAGSPDNVSGNGQAIQMSGQGSMLGILGAATGGVATGPVTVIYTDGTQTTGQVTLNNFTSNSEPAPGDILATTTDDQTRGTAVPVSIYAVSIPIDPTKTVADVILPSSSTELSTAASPFHVFALGIGTPAG